MWQRDGYSIWKLEWTVRNFKTYFPGVIVYFQWSQLFLGGIGDVDIVRGRNNFILPLFLGDLRQWRPTADDCKL